MGRLYSEELGDLPRVTIPDWELLQRLEQLVESGLPLTRVRRPIFCATDKRGTYDAPTIDEFRHEVEAQETPPDAVRLTVGRPGSDRFINVYASTLIGSGGRVEASDEAFVNHIAARIRDLFLAASERQNNIRPPEPPVSRPERAVTRPPSPTTTHRQEPGRTSRHVGSRMKTVAYDPWVVSVGAGLVAAATGVLLTLWLTGH